MAPWFSGTAELGNDTNNIYWSHMAPWDLKYILSISTDELCLNYMNISVT